MIIFPGARITALDSTTVRIEFGESPPLTVGELLPGEIDWLLEAFELAGDSTAQDRPRRRAKLSYEGQRELQKLLVAHGFASSKNLASSTEASPTKTAEALAQFSVFGSAHSSAARDLSARRANAIIAVKHVSRTTLEAVRVLINSGVYKFVIDDPRPNTAIDLLAVAGFPGSTPSIEEATSAFVRSLHRNVQVLSTQCRPQLTVLGGDHEPAYLDSALLTSLGAAHLVVTVDSRRTTIGPLVLPQHEASLCCYQHQLSPADKDAPFGIRARTAGPPTIQSSVHAAVTGALVAHNALHFIDGYLPTSADTISHVSHRTNTPDYESLVSDSTCFCANPRATLGLATSEL